MHVVLAISVLEKALKKYFQASCVLFAIRFLVYSLVPLENKGRGKSLVIPVVKIVLLYVRSYWFVTINLLLLLQAFCN